MPVVSADRISHSIKVISHVFIITAALREGESGSKLLSYIWSAIDQSGNNEYQHLLIYLLNALCQTYFNQLQRWLYEGEIDEHHNELFVTCCSEKTLNHRSKEFFDRGFHVRSSMVPGFLDGYEKAILQCGKYNRLLKTYREDVRKTITANLGILKPITLF